MAQIKITNDGKIIAEDFVLNSTISLKNVNYALQSLPSRIGGSIFYIDSSVSGSTYKFYTSGMVEITEWSTISDLSNAYFYSKIGENTTSLKDKFYVIDSNNGIIKYDGSNYIMWATDVEDLSSYSSSIDVLSSASTTIGTGKRNTKWILENRNTSVYYPAHNSISSKITVWDFCKDCNDNSLNDCTDWFIPSIGEISQIKNSGIIGSSLDELNNTLKYEENLYSFLLSSSAHTNSKNCWGWYFDTDSYINSANSSSRKIIDNGMCAAVIRSF